MNNPIQENYSFFDLLRIVFKPLIWPGLLVLIAFSCQRAPECPKGYQGVHCEQEIAPSAIHVKEIRVLDCPLPTLASAGKEPAITGVVNLEVEISNFYYSDEPNIILITGAQLATGFDQVNTFSPQDFFVTNTIVEPEIPHRISLFDRHSNLTSRTLVSSIDFYPYRASKGFPETIYLTNGTVSFELVLAYEWGE